MALLSDYSGHMLNHVETLYQRGERELAIALFEALGCRVVDTETPCETRRRTASRTSVCGTRRSRVSSA